MQISVIDFALERSHLCAVLAAEGFSTRALNHVDDLACPDVVLLAAPAAADDVLAAISTVRTRHADSVVLVATDSGTLEQRLACYEAGADDCLCRPFHLAEMAAKLRAMRRRRLGGAALALLPASDVTLDCGALELRAGDRRQNLTKREAGLLASLARAEGDPVDRESILRDAWGAPARMTSNSVDVYVGYVRRKLRLLDAGVTVKTVRGYGFQVARRAGR